MTFILILQKSKLSWLLTIWSANNRMRDNLVLRLVDYCFNIFRGVFVYRTTALFIKRLISINTLVLTNISKNHTWWIIKELSFTSIIFNVEMCIIFICFLDRQAYFAHFYSFFFAITDTIFTNTCVKNLSHSFFVFFLFSISLQQTTKTSLPICLQKWWILTVQSSKRAQNWPFSIQKQIKIKRHKIKSYMDKVLNKSQLVWVTSFI